MHLDYEFGKQVHEKFYFNRRPSGFLFSSTYPILTDGMLDTTNVIYFRTQYRPNSALDLLFELEIKPEGTNNFRGPKYLQSKKMNGFEVGHHLIYKSPTTNSDILYFNSEKPIAQFNAMLPWLETRIPELYTLLKKQEYTFLSKQRFSMNETRKQLLRFGLKNKQVDYFCKWEHKVSERENKLKEIMKRRRGY